MSVCWEFLRLCVLCHIVLVLGAGVSALHARVSCLWAGRQMWHARGLCCVPGRLVRLFCVCVAVCCGAPLCCASVCVGCCAPVLVLCVSVVLLGVDVFQVNLVTAAML